MNKSINEKIKKIARSNYEIEVCGFIILNKNGFIEVIEINNDSDNPQSSFEFSSKEIIEQEMLGNKILAIFHSHPRNNENYPKFSQIDIKYSEELGIHFYLYDLRLDQFIIYEPSTYDHEPLENRPFVLGFWDCYTLCRDYYKNKGIKLNNYLPPPNKNYYSNDNSFELNASKEGFSEIPFKEVKEGDILLFKIGNSSYGNHIGIYIENMKILHQTRSNISQIMDLDGRWMNYFYKAYKYK